MRPDGYREGHRFDSGNLHMVLIPEISEPFFIMNFFVYIIFSEKLNRYYVGHTDNIVIRLTQHNDGLSSYTAKAKDWKLAYSEIFITREEAHKREREIKAKKSRKYIEYLLSSN